MPLALSAGQYRLLHALSNTPDIGLETACHLVDGNEMDLLTESCRLHELDLAPVRRPGGLGPRIAFAGDRARLRRLLADADILDPLDGGAPAVLTQTEKRLLDAVRTNDGSLALSDGAAAIGGDEGAVRTIARSLLGKGYGMIIEPGTYTDRVELYCDMWNGVSQAPLRPVQDALSSWITPGGLVLMVPIGGGLAFALLMALAGPGA